MTLISENISKKDRERLNNLYNEAINIVYNAVGKKTYENYHNGAYYIDVAPLGNRAYGYCWRHSMCGYSTIFLKKMINHIIWVMCQDIVVKNYWQN